MPDQTRAVLTLTNGVLAEPEGGGPVDVYFVIGGGGDRLLSDVLADAVAHCNRTKEYAQITLTMTFKTGQIVVNGPLDVETVLAGTRSGV